jgi:small subunit ribosomal protein S20
MCQSTKSSESCLNKGIMANTKSAQKQAKQNEARRKRNLARRTAIKTSVKKIIAVLEQGTDKTKAETLLSDIAAKLARAKSKKVMHRNTASRKLSRLTKRVNATFAQNSEKATQPK